MTFFECGSPEKVHRACTKGSVGRQGRNPTADLCGKQGLVDSNFLLTEETEDEKQRPAYLVSRETLGVFDFRDDSPQLT